MRVVVAGVGDPGWRLVFLLPRSTPTATASALSPIGHVRKLPAPLPWFLLVPRD
jgi:hypothetical protein